MKSTSIVNLLNAIKGKLHSGQLEGEVTSVSTDTRTIRPGAVFFALRGDNFDAHNFLSQAVVAGASVLVVEEIPATYTSSNVVVIEVKSSLNALQAFAAWYRRELDIQVVAITGSNGKTSTKDFTNAVLSERFKVNATVGNLNNHIGLPLTVLRTDEDKEVCILEMGMNHSGEIAPLCQIAKPQIGVITNVGTAHIEFLKSRQAIAEEKGALAKALPVGGVLVTSAACDYVDYFKDHTRARTMIVGNGRGEVRAEELKMNKDGSQFLLVIGQEDPVSVNLNVVGRHMISNALLAAGVGHSLGMSILEIAAGLNKASITSGRLCAFDYDGITIFDDTYNANPESMMAAIEALSEIRVESTARRIIVMGKMAELGKHVEQASVAIGSLAAERGISVATLGAEAMPMSKAAIESGGDAIHFDTEDSLVEWLKASCASGDTVLFKGSRAAAMERVMQKAFPKD